MKSMPIWMSAVVIVASAVAVTSVGAQTPTLKRETLNLDSYERGTRASGPVATRGKLATDKWYLVSVKGTFSYFSRTLLRGQRYCGMPKRRPQRPSKGRANGPVFADAETIFALPRGRSGRCPVLPYHWGNFQMTARKRFSHVDPIGGPRSRPNRRHRYRYLLKGRGRVARFRLQDVYARDNYGVLSITVRRATASEVLRGQPPASPAPAPIPNVPPPTGAG